MPWRRGRRKSCVQEVLPDDETGVILALAAGLCLSAGCTRYEEVSVTAGVKETEETKVIQITEPETEPETEGDRELLRIEKDGKIPSYLTGK